MTLHRTTRRWLIGWLVSTLLFMQLAVAAYVCPLPLQAAATTLPAPADDMAYMPDMPDMPNCPGMRAQALDAQQPLLCKAHCGDDGQPLQSVQPSLPLDAIGPVSMALFEWRPLGQIASLAAERHGLSASQTGPPRGWPPLYLSLLILRN